MIDIFKDSLSLFLQTTGVLVVLVTLWNPRKATVILGAPIIVFNLEQALKKPVYGTTPCLAVVLQQLAGSDDTTGSRLLGIRGLMGDVDVIRRLVEWKPIEVHAIYTHSPTDDDSRWTSEIARFAAMYKLHGLSTDIPNPPEQVTMRTSLLVDLPMRLRHKYGYELLAFDEGDSTNCSWKTVSEDTDIWQLVEKAVTENCKSPLAVAQALWALGFSSKCLNVIEIRNEFLESLGKIHLRISHEGRGVIKLIDSIALKEGLEIVNSTAQFVHVTLSDLPPDSRRYCLLETSIQPIAADSIEMQSALLQRLPASIIRNITFVGGVVAVVVGLILGISRAG